MQPCLFSSECFQLQKAEEGVVQALEVAADAVEELSRGSEANQDTLEEHCKSFLETVKAVQDSLVLSAPSSSSNKPYQGRAYLSQLQASLLAKQVELAEQQLLLQQQSAPDSNSHPTQGQQQVDP